MPTSAKPSSTTRRGFLLEGAALAAAIALDAPAQEPGQPLPTSTNTACADALISIYEDEATRAGASAFAGWDRMRMEPAYAWTVQLEAGYTAAEIDTFRGKGVV